MPIDLRVTEQDWRALRSHFSSSFRTKRGHETGAIGILGESRGSKRHEFLLARVLWPRSGDIEAGPDGLVFSASYLRRAHLMMRAERLAGLVTFHTHPHADEHVGFSPYDDSQDPLLIENLLELEPSTRLVSIVVGKNAQAGRVWFSGNRLERLGQLITVGDQLSYHALSGRPQLPPPPAAAFDRALAMTAAGALNRLSQMVIAVVGASGTGSLICELLTRAGCQSLILIDDDVMRDINLNRILYATADDAANKTPKVEVLRRGIEGLGLGCRVDAIQGNVLAVDVIAKLRDADVIFGCVDKAYPRKMLCEFSYRYLRPYIDIGSEIGGDEQGIVSLDARTSYVAPGRWCLCCTGLVTSRELAFESLSHAERQRVIALGYSRDLVIQKPAVMDLNMRSASFGMTLLRHLLQPFLLTPLPVTIAENLVTYTVLPLDKPKAANPDCHLCRRNPLLGYGDCAEPIGLQREQLGHIFGTESDVPGSMRSDEPPAAATIEGGHVAP